MSFFDRDRSSRDGQRGQGLTEFALTIPLVITLIMGVFEFGVALAANIGINRAAQNGAHMASTAGRLAGADCLVLDEIERSVLLPNSASRILDVRIELTDLEGKTVYLDNEWDRGGSTTCDVAGKLTLKLPYTLTRSGYAETERCNVLGGCPLMSPSRTTVDNIAVVIRYRHEWVTPLGSILPLGVDGSHWEFEQRNVFRMEPHR